MSGLEVQIVIRPRIHEKLSLRPFPSLSGSLYPLASGRPSKATFSARREGVSRVFDQTTRPPGRRQKPWVTMRESFSQQPPPRQGGAPPISWHMNFSINSETMRSRSIPPRLPVSLSLSLKNTGSLFLLLLTQRCSPFPSFSPIKLHLRWRGRIPKP